MKPKGKIMKSAGQKPAAGKGEEKTASPDPIHDHFSGLGKKSWAKRKAAIVAAAKTTKK